MSVSHPGDNRPIGVLRALVVAFDRVAARPLLILPPLLLDLFLWLGPRLRPTGVVREAVAALTVPPEASPALAEQVGALREGLLFLGEHLNLFSALSALPLGVPSIMGARMPAESPLGVVPGVEIHGLGLAMALWLALTAAGLGLGAWYHRLLAREVATDGQVAPWLTTWGRGLLMAALFYLALTVVTGGTLLAATLAGLVLPLISVGLIFIGFSTLLWGAVYLYFAPHGLVRYRLGVLRALWDSATVVRWNLLATLAFLGLAFGIGWLTDQVWLLPPEGSWFNLLALVGHAFVSATLLLGGYAFYQGRREWLLRAGWLPAPVAAGAQDRGNEE